MSLALLSKPWRLLGNLFFSPYFFLCTRPCRGFHNALKDSFFKCFTGPNPSHPKNFLGREREIFKRVAPHPARGWWWEEQRFKKRNIQRELSRTLLKIFILFIFFFLALLWPQNVCYCRWSRISNDNMLLNVSSYKLRLAFFELTFLIFEFGFVLFAGTCRGARSTTSWMVPRELPSDDMERLSASMAAWLERPSSDSPFTAISWSLTVSRPSWWGEKKTLLVSWQSKKPSRRTWILKKKCQMLKRITGIINFYDLIFVFNYCKKLRLKHWKCYDIASRATKKSKSHCFKLYLKKVNKDKTFLPFLFLCFFYVSFNYLSILLIFIII